MRKFRFLALAGLIAAGAFATGVFAQDATPEAMPTDSGMMEEGMMMATPHVRIAYMVSDGPSVDVYVRPSSMGMMGMEGDMMATAEAMMPDMMATAEMGMDMGMMEGMSEMGILINTLTPGIVTEFLNAPTGSYEVTITAEGDMAPVVGPLPVTLAGGEFLTVAVVGSVANNTVQVIVLPEALSSYTAGGAAVTVINAIEGSPAVTIQTADGIVLVPSIGYIGAMDMMMEDGGMMATDEAMMPMDGTMMATEEAMMPMDGIMMGAMVPMTIGTASTVFVPAEFTGATYDIRVVGEDGAELFAQDGVTIDADTAYLIVAYSLDGSTVQLAMNTANLGEMMGEMMMDSGAMMEMTATPGA